jgi:hypothetical protein
VPGEPLPVPLRLISPASLLAISNYNYLFVYTHMCVCARNSFLNDMNNQLITLPRMFQRTFSVHGGVVREPTYL